ncbi:MAG TPA: calcium-binding protein, partial [Candidatus Obscuribacterales bacterium]
ADTLTQVLDGFDTIIAGLQTEGSPSALELANLLQELSTSLTTTVDDLVDGNPPVADDLLDQLLQPTDDLGDLTETLNTNHRIGTDGDDSFEATLRHDVFEMGAGNDTVTATFSNLQQSDSLDGAGGIDRFVVTGGSNSDSLILRSSSEASRHNLVPSPDMEGTVVQNFEQFDLSGFLGQTTFTGGLEDNLVIGGAGNDVLNGGGGNDGLDGGDGNDRLVGGASDDVLNGGLGNDRLVAGAGDDVLNGGAGDDSLGGVRGNNRLIGGAGSDFIKGGAERDVLLGGADNDRLIGGQGNDILNGGAGNDRLVSGTGNNRLTGGQGDDILTGGIGRNVLNGGGGRDRFVFEKAQGQANVVTDFNSRQDQIVITRRGFGAAGLSVGGLSDRQFVLGSRAQSADERFIYDDQSGTLFFDVDGNGSQKQRAIAILGGQPSLSARQIVIA